MPQTRKGAPDWKRFAAIGPCTRRNAVRALAASAVAGCLAPDRVRAAKSRLPLQAKWTVFYGHDAPLESLAAFEVVILDPQFQGSVKTLGARGVQTLGYVSLGEFSSTSGYFSLLKSRAALLHENPNWPGSFAMDVRHEAWRALVLNQIIPDVLRKGFGGLFLDTLDTPPYLETLDPVGRKGLGAAAISLVKEIRARHPNVPIMMNRGYAILPDLRHTIDAVMAESLLTTYDSGAQSFRFHEQSEIDAQLTLLRCAKEGKAPLPVYSLDYWDPADAAGLKKIYAAERALGHTPYVATKLLNVIVLEPKA